VTEAADPSLSVRAAALARHYIPITVWLPAYPRKDLRYDIVGGLTSWGVMIPVALAYAGLAGLPPEIGLVTAFAALAAYAVFGTSRHLKVTTSSTMAVMSASIVAPLALGDPARFLALSAALALVVGVILVGAGLLRLGFISEFLAKPVVTGFVMGVALTVIVGQLPKLFGVPSGSGSIFDQLQQLVTHLPETNPWTLAMGLLALAIIFVLRLISRRIPGALVALIVGIAASSALDLAAHGVATVGAVSTGLPGISLPAVGLSDLTFLAAGAAGIVFLAVGESLGAGRSFAMRHGYELDPDQELIGLGAANISAGLLGGFSVDASLSQTATGETAGVRTQLSSLITSALVLATAVVLAPLFSTLPQAVLGAIVIASIVSLVDLAEMRRYWAWRRSDAALAAVALIGVVTTSVLAGLVIAVLISLSLLLYRASRPYIAELYRLAGKPAVYSDRSRHPNATATPGMLLARIDAPLYFFNVTVARTQLLALVDAAQPPPSVLILDIAATADLDVTSSDMLGQLVTDLADRSVVLALVQIKGPVRDRFRKTGLMERIGEDRLYRSMAEAVAAEQHRLEHEAVPSDAPTGVDAGSPTGVDDPALDG